MNIFIHKYKDRRKFVNNLLMHATNLKEIINKCKIISDHLSSLGDSELESVWGIQSGSTSSDMPFTVQDIRNICTVFEQIYKFLNNDNPTNSDYNSILNQFSDF